MNGAMGRLTFLTVFCLLVARAHSQQVCYACTDCGWNVSGAVICGSPATGGGGGGVGPTLPTSPQPTYPTTPSWQVTWYPPLSSTIAPWPRAYGYVCYRVQRYISAENRYAIDRGCAFQLASQDQTCHSVTGFQGYYNCELCTGSLCNY
uniref:Uncharacterized protein n=1 Tax=Anopheles dirus TaxID=7168 RepID=A0A182NHV1_9DIPT